MASSRAARPLITSPLGVARLYARAAAAAASSAGAVAAASAPAPTAGAASERRVPPPAGRRQHDMSDLTRQAGRDRAAWANLVKRAGQLSDDLAAIAQTPRTDQEALTVADSL